MVGLNKNLKYFHYDNPGKNQTFKQTCKQEGLVVDFEYTAPGTPQRNGCVKQQNCQVEPKFCTLINQACAMLNDGKFNACLQIGLWTKAANIAMLL